MILSSADLDFMFLYNLVITVSMLNCALQIFSFSRPRDCGCGGCLVTVYRKLFQM